MSFDRIPIKPSRISLSHTMVRKQLNQFVWQHLARKYYFFLLSLPVQQSSTALFSSLPVLRTLFHISSSLLYSELFESLFLRCAKVLVFCRARNPVWIKKSILQVSGFTGIKINTANTINSIIFSVKSPYELLITSSFADQWKKKSLCSPWFVIPLGTRHKLKPGPLFLSLEQPRMTETKRRHPHSSLHSPKMAAQFVLTS